MIGIFDSGVGGLALFREIAKLLPHQSLYYFADSAHFPYGEKSKEEVVAYSLECATFLLEQKIQILAVACVTATSLAIESLCKINIPVFNVVDSLVEQVVSGKRVALLGTNATIDSGYIQKRLSPLTVFPIRCSPLVRAVETGEDAVALLQSYGDFFQKNQIDTVILACTHFSHLLPLMQLIWGEDIHIIHEAQHTAKRIASTCQGEGEASHYFFTTGDPVQFKQQVATILQLSEPKVIHVPTVSIVRG